MIFNIFKHIIYIILSLFICLFLIIIYILFGIIYIFGMTIRKFKKNHKKHKK